MNWHFLLKSKANAARMDGGFFSKRFPNEINIHFAYVVAAAASASASVLVGWNLVGQPCHANLANKF